SDLTTGRDSASRARARNACPGPLVPGVLASAAGESRPAIRTPASPTGTSTKNSHACDPAAAVVRPRPRSATASAPSAPAAAPNMLYQPYTVAVPASSAASIACSKVVAGPLSTMSVDRVPVSATSSSTHNGAPD